MISFFIFSPICSLTHTRIIEIEKKYALKLLLLINFSSFNIYYLILTKKEINNAAHTQIFVNQCLAKV